MHRAAPVPNDLNSRPELGTVVLKHSVLRYSVGVHDDPQKITYGELRASGVRDVLVYCCDHRCSHHITISADQWPDHVRLSDIEPDFVCTACGTGIFARAYGRSLGAVVRAVRRSIILPGGRKLLTLRDAATFIPVAIINNGGTAGGSDMFRTPAN